MQRKTRYAAALFGLLALAAGAASGAMQARERPFGDGAVGADGALRVPENFRRDYVLLGAWSVAGDADTGAAISLHNVYAPGWAVDAYRETGAWPDGAVLVKELLATETESLTTGAASRAAAGAGHFVMVKDAAGRFPDHPLWGEGWGWAFFEPGRPARTVSTDYAADCLGCHEPARATDLVYVQGYPVLR